MHRCKVCEFQPAPLPDSGRLYIAPPVAHAEGRLLTALRRAEIPFDEPAPGTIGLDLRPGLLPRLVDELGATLGPLEIQNARALLTDRDRPITVADLAAMQPLGELVARVRGEWLAELIREDRLATVFQPIVCSGRPEVVFAHECLLRGLDRDGVPIPPGRLYETARASGLLFSLDRAARLRAIKSAVEQGLSGLIFINFNPASIYDPAFCLRSTIAATAEAGIAPDRVVFEVVESDEAHADLPGILARYRAAGFRVALDDLGAGFGSLNRLATLRPDFIKVDMDLIQGVDRDSYKAGITAKILEMAQRLGVGTIAEGVETEREYDWVEAHGVDYVQGFLFGRPACPPPVPRSLPSRARAALANGCH
ncbi:MAG TPA: EAL domain-containing protein [Isosphaeraceae bacterium]|jgi:EAL domain-containing protein (putative c-di-GMP-specific phosphodiesterase class I)|nr:EAL domain-containing protein [Isosphaeraceae bacterium]